MKLNLIILLAVYFTITPSAISDEVELSTSPDGKITLLASSKADLRIMEDRDHNGGIRVHGTFPDYDLLVKFRDQEGKLLHEVTNPYSPLSASWHPESGFVIIYGHGYRFS